MTPRSDDLPDGPDATRPGTKEHWRERLLAARRAVPEGLRAERAVSLTRGALELAASAGGPVCAYLPVGAEPWSVAGVEALRAAGHEVLVPVVPPQRGPLDWARFEGVDALGAGPIGLREPVGPRLGPDAVGRARLLLVPGLAADRRGVRLGRGAGYYDHTLPLADAVPVIVLHDDELVDALPEEAHDRRVGAALLPGAGLTPLA